MTVTIDQLDRIRQLTWLQARAHMTTILLQNGLISVSPEGVAGFWRGEEWVSLYELFGEPDDNR